MSTSTQLLNASKRLKLPLEMKAWNIYSYKGPSALVLEKNCEVPIITQSNVT